MSGVVFISYAWEEDEGSHQERVKSLANWLKSEGVTVIFDLFVDDGGPDEGWPDWCENKARESSRILTVASQSYFRRWNGEEEPGKGLGASREAKTIRERVYDAGSTNSFCRSIFFADDDEKYVPVTLKNFTKFRFPENQQEILNWIRSAAKKEGNEKNPPVLEDNDLAKTLDKYVNSRDWWCFCIVVESNSNLGLMTDWAISRLSVDHLIEEGGVFRWRTPATSINNEPGISSNESQPIPKRLRKPLTVKTEDIFSSSELFLKAVEALCAADVLIADVTGFNRSLMILLGIRSAVRRGVTVVSSAQKPQLHEYNTKIPFNLKEISILDHGEATDTGSGNLWDVVCKGMDNFIKSPNYQDLPAFSEVRVENSSWNRHDALMLCSFSEEYSRGPFQFFSGEISRLAREKFDGKPVASRRVIDDLNPRLNAQCLYEAIRHSSLCMIDWTEWRANVFFEMGVRLAVNPAGAVCLLDPDPEWLRGECIADPPESEIKILKKLFNPYVYSNDQTTSLNIVQQAFAKYNDASKKSLVFGIVYDVVSEAIRPEESALVAPIYEVLLDEVNRTDGKGDFGKGTLGILHAGKNPQLVKEHRLATQSKLLAAWYFMDLEYSPHLYGRSDLLDPDKMRLARCYLEIGRMLSDTYLKGKKEREKLRFDIADKCDDLENEIELRLNDNGTNPEKSRKAAKIG